MLKQKLCGVYPFGDEVSFRLSKIGLSEYFGQLPFKHLTFVDKDSNRRCLTSLAAKYSSLLQISVKIFL